MSKKAFEEKLAAITALRAAPAAEAEAGLRKALKDRNNYAVSRAAEAAAARGFDTLIPDLLAAFDRFFHDPVKTDPQCWAKNSAVAALKALGLREASVYLRGLTYTQWEPVYTPPFRVDTATGLRGSCALALIACPLPLLTILRHLTPLLGDNETPVRIDAIRAITHLADPAGALLLRLKASLGDKEPEVLGACFSALFALEAGSEAAPFIEGFLASAETDTQLEAACALAQSAEPAALEAVKRYWETRRPTVEIRRAILVNLGVSPLREAADFLRRIAESSPELAATAREALAASRFSKSR